MCLYSIVSSVLPFFFLPRIIRHAKVLCLFLSYWQRTCKTFCLLGYFCEKSELITIQEPGLKHTYSEVWPSEYSGQDPSTVKALVSVNFNWVNICLGILLKSSVLKVPDLLMILSNVLLVHLFRIVAKFQLIKQFLFLQLNEYFYLFLYRFMFKIVLSDTCTRQID